MSDELDTAIKKLELEWAIYHKNPRNNHMPDMVELTKLRIKRKMLNG